MKRLSAGELTLIYGLEPSKSTNNYRVNATSKEIKDYVREVPDHMVDLLREHCREVCIEDAYEFEASGEQISFDGGRACSASTGRLLFLFQEHWRFHLARYFYNTGENDETTDT